MAGYGRHSYEPEINDAVRQKYRKIEFSNGISKFGLKGLINEGKWAGILNGEYDNYIKNKDSQNSSFDLGIPVWSED